MLTLPKLDKSARQAISRSERVSKKLMTGTALVLGLVTFPSTDAQATTSLAVLNPSHSVIVLSQPVGDKSEGAASDHYSHYSHASHQSHYSHYSSRY